ncbi:MAG: 2-hydroxyacyl-CoA dehydratase [bacterium]|nr:2-hydroxyacyl-CoA dehydratase [bacterium]
MYDYFDNIISGISESMEENPGKPHARKKYALGVAGLGRELYSEQNAIAWCGIAAPFDLLRTMGITSCYVEFIGGMLASTGMVGSFIEEAEHAGYASDACSYHRSVMGAVKKGIVPEPEFLIATTCPCSGGVAVLENLSREFKKDLFVLHVPQDTSGNNVQYLADQIKDLTDFVSAHTGNPLDYDKLRDTVEKSNKLREDLVDVYKLTQSVPSPTNGRDLNNLGIVLPLLAGTDEGIEIVRSYKEEFETRVSSNTDDMESQKLRLMWVQNRIQFKHPLEKLLKEEYGAIIVVDELNDVLWDPIDPDDPFPGFAQRAISIPFNGPSENRINHLKEMARNYKVDGAINPCNWGCRQGAGARGLVEEGLKSIDVPVLNLEVDCVDLRNFAEGQLRTRLEAFMEMLENNK